MNTNIAAGLRLANYDVFALSSNRRDARDVAILLTDGKANRETNSVLREAINLKKRGVEVV